MRLLIFAFIALGIGQCSTEKEMLSQDDDRAALNKQFEELRAISESVSCTDPSTWKFTAVGNKACGGPATYMAYSTEINESTFLEKVKTYTQAEKDFNAKWGAISDCSIQNPPSGIECVDGKASLIYRGISTLY